MAARALVARTAPVPGAAPDDEHPWRVVLLVLAVLVVALGLVALVVIASMSGPVTDVWHSMTSVLDQL